MHARPVSPIYAANRNVLSRIDGCLLASINPRAFKTPMRVQRSVVRPSLLKAFRTRLLEEIVRRRDDAFGEGVTSLRSLIPLASPVDERV